MVRPRYESEQTIQERFETFHKANPYIYNLLVYYAIEAAEAGWKHYGIKSLFERVRWHIYMEIKDGRGFKLNNDFTSRYARILNDDPRIIEHGGERFFQTRELAAA